MGMDVYGKNATTEEGAYFRNNVWWWRPLANYILEFCPEEAEPCEYWHSNDGDGLDEEGALRLAAKLRELLKSGHTTAYQVAYEARLEAIPPEECDLCGGTGVRSDSVGTQMLMPERKIPATAEEAGKVGFSYLYDEKHPRKGKIGWCNACDGRGKRENFEASYPFSAENVEEFAKFLEGCGGFEIC